MSGRKVLQAEKSTSVEYLRYECDWKVPGKLGWPVPSTDVNLHCYLYDLRQTFKSAKLSHEQNMANSTMHTGVNITMNVKLRSVKPSSTKPGKQ